jgi:isoaspartyl peptidase/L-asparaginase-like protein (Ntn-hydrolase superfamily)
MGEEIMKGVLSYQAVVYLKAGMTAQEAAEKAVNETDASLRKRNGYADAMSLIVIDKEGNWGVGTNVEFTFVYASDEKKPTVYRAVLQDGRTVFTEI